MDLFVAVPSSWIFDLEFCCLVAVQLWPNCAVDLPCAWEGAVLLWRLFLCCTLDVALWKMCFCVLQTWNFCLTWICDFWLHLWLTAGLWWGGCRKQSLCKNFLITVFLNPKLKASISYSYTALFFALEYESIWIS